MSAATGFELVIGLEVHVQLDTRSKLFSPAPVAYGTEPNHGVHAIDLALPGVLPVLNRAAVELGIRACLATDCTVHPTSVFERKNYFYPDLPKGYQISQLEAPLGTGGHIDIEVEHDGAPTTRRVRITRIQLEEDAGKSIHDAGTSGGAETQLDLNRTGVPLIEIVSEPDMRSAAEAGAYLRTLRGILRSIEVSDANMEKGQLRCDVNLSLRRPGESTMGTRTELKNMNSFRYVEEAIHFESARQARLLESGGTIEQATIRFDPAEKRIFVMRTKENADDYRYFPDPDLIPLILDPEQIESIRRSLPELPERKRTRFQAEYGLSSQDAQLLTSSRRLSEFFEEAAKLHGSPKSVANWVLRDLLQALKEGDLEPEASALTVEAFVALIQLVDSGRVTPATARPLLPELVKTGGDPEAWVRERGLEAVSDAGALTGAVDEVLAANPDAAERYRGGDRKVLNFLMGQVMKQTRGKADPGVVRDLLARRLGS